MQMCFIMGCTVSTPQGSTVQVPNDDISLPADQQSPSSPVHRLVYTNGSNQVGIPEGPDRGKCQEKLQIDNSQQVVMNSSALLTKSANLLEDEFPRSPSFKYYLEKDFKLDLNKESQLIGKPVNMPSTEGKLIKLQQLIDNSKALIPNQEAEFRANKKKRKWKLKFLTKKCKDIKNEAQHQPQVLVIPSRLSQEHAAAIMLQKITRGFLLRKDLRILKNIDAIAEEFGKKLVEYEEVLKSGGRTKFRDDDNITIMQLQCQLNTVRGEMVYKGKVIEKITILQERVDAIDAEAFKPELDMTPESTIGVNTDELRVESFKFSTLPHKKVVQTWFSMEQAVSDNSSAVIQGGDNIMENNDSDPIVINDANSMMEENQIIKAVNLMKELTVDKQEKIDTGSGTIVENVDPTEEQEKSTIMVELNRLTKKSPSFDLKDETSLKEETPVESMDVTKTPQMNEMIKISDFEKDLCEQELVVNDPVVEIVQEVYDPIKYQKLLNTFSKLKRQKEFRDQVLQISQLETYFNQTGEKKIKGLKEIMERLQELSIESKEMNTLMKGLENRVQELQKSVHTLESRGKTNMKNYGRRCSFS